MSTWIRKLSIRMDLDNRKASKCLLYLVFALIPVFGFGQGFPSVKNVEIPDYTGSKQIWAISQDTNGIMLFGNSSGLLKYDGVKWEFLHPPVNYVIRTLFLSSEGSVYYGGENDFGVIKPDSLNRIKLVSLFENDANTDIGEVWDIIEYKDAIYFQSNSFVFRFAGDSLTAIESDSRLRRLHIFKDTLVTFKEGAGMVEVREKELSLLPGGSFFSDDLPYILEKTGGEYHFLSRGKGVSFYKNGSFQSTRAEQYQRIITSNPYRSAKKSGQDSSYTVASLSGGILILDDEANIYSQINSNNGLSTNIAYEVFYDTENTLWAGLEGAINKVVSNNGLVQIDDRLSFSGSVTSIEKYNDRFYIGSTEGLFVFDTKQALLKAEERFSRIYDMQVHDNKLYLATPEGVHFYEGNVLSETDIDEVLKFRVSGDSELFFIKTKGIISFSDIQESEEIIFADLSVSDVAVFQNYMWLLDGRGIVLKYDGNKVIEQYNLEAENTPEFLKVIDQRLYLGTASGLMFYDQQTNSFERDNKFNDRAVSETQVSIFEKCSDNVIWVRNNRKVKKAIFESGIWRTYETPFQLIGLDESIFEIKCFDNQIWFGGVGAVYVYREDENSVQNTDTRFKTNISQVLVKNDSLIYGGYGDLKNPISLSYANNEVRFNYAAASYVSPEHNSYQVKLEGFDKEWSNWTSETQKDYTNIPEGQYTFLVRSKNVYNVAGQMDSFSFQVLPPWYRTWWAYILYTIVISSILYAVYKIRINQILRVQRIRNNIASDLHDEVSATLSSISYFAEAIKSDRLKEDKSRFVDLIANSAGDAKEKITDIVWAINPEHDDWQNFLSKCRRFASDLLESKEIEYSLKIDEFIPGKLDMQLRQHLWLIFKEMVTNAVRHSKATQLDVIMKYEDGDLKLVIQDNGEGMDVDIVRKGNGLVNIHKRAEQLNANISLKTSEGFGTRWMLKVPL
ncbi:triple tyrosine motif-containing protein [Gracilimonas sp.]|uniref:sensor histidine kinase n=1 Tax=Gracilimonas sp. TaxID=1974203 RepID=UPI0032EFAC85